MGNTEGEETRAEVERLIETMFFNGATDKGMCASLNARGYYLSVHEVAGIRRKLGFSRVVKQEPVVAPVCKKTPYEDACVILRNNGRITRRGDTELLDGRNATPLQKIQAANAILAKMGSPLIEGHDSWRD